MESNDSNVTGDAGCGTISQERDSTNCVKVAVHIRPLINLERLLGCSDCITIVPGEPRSMVGELCRSLPLLQKLAIRVLNLICNASDCKRSWIRFDQINVQIGNHAFTFDHVYGSTGSPSFLIYDDCVAPLVDALFHGYNATVLAYGQTGSGKTYTMGTGYIGEANNGGIIPKVMETIFERIDALKINTEFLIRVSFIEIFKEEVLDLLDPNLPASMKSDGVHPTKLAVPAKIPIQIRETMNGGIALAGVTEAEVQSKEEMASLLAQGSQCRATGSTNMNSQSSRSHAIFTITIEQKKIMSYSTAINNEEVGDDILCAKLHLVDLAGSERAKRTGADGMRLKEGIHINRGLLALGNVISALGDDKKRKEGAHVPYRDSKLTRLLQDSLGGNSKTVMIACVSPADTNAEETLNTLKYANRARNIQNKAIVNRDPMMAQVQRMRSQIEQLQAELLYSRGEGAPFEELEVLRHKISVLEASNADLQQELQESRSTCNRFAQQAVDAQVEKDKLIVKVELARNGKPWDEIDSADGVQDFDLVKGYVTKIQELEGELQRLKSANISKRSGFIDRLVLEDVELGTKDALLPSMNAFPTGCGSKALSISEEAEDAEKELEHSSIQDRLDQELQELDKRLEQKEAEMKRVAKVDTSVLKQHYEKKLLELEHEKKALLKEIEDLRANLANVSSTSDDGAQKLREDYLQKLNILEAQVAELKKKQEAQSQLLRQKQKSDEAAKRLQEEIQRIKTQKVQLQHKIKQESEQFRLWRASREKEVLQLKKEGRRNEYEMHKLLALNQRQKMVLQRKTEEASMATKRLKELLEARKASSRETFGGGNSNGPGLQGNEKALLRAIEHELEVMVRVHEVRSEYERQILVRGSMAKELAKLKEESEMLKQNFASDCNSTMSPGARNSRIHALENMLATSSSTLVSMASHLSEAEERERVFSGKGRWNQVRSLAYAKNLMNYLFNIASSSRCQLRNKEVECREVSSEVKELKDKIIRLTAMMRQIEIKKHEGEVRRQEKKAASRKQIFENSITSGTDNSITGEEGLPYYLRKGPRSSHIFGTNYVDLSEDMDTSESDQSDQSDDDWALNGSGRRLAQKRGSSTGSQAVELDSPEEPQNSAAPSSESCCSCGRSSQCKTKKCECRAVGGMCGAQCGCRPGLCANREGSVVKNDQEGLKELEVMEVGGNGPVAIAPEGANNVSLASEGAALLQSAMAERPIELEADSVQRRKPLNDIGNTLGNSNLPKGNKRKKWRKSVIQLVPAAPPSSQPENSEVAESTGNPIKPDIPLKLPRAMRSTAGNNGNPLRERNSDLTEESRSEKDAGNIGARSLLRPARDPCEKENNRM